MSRRRILYVENGLGLGGATRCLHHLVAHAEQRGYEPFVAIAYHDPVIGNTLNAEHRLDISPYRRWGTSAQPEPQLNELSRLERRASAAARSTFNRLARDGPLTRFLGAQIDRLQIDLVHTNNGLLANRAELRAALRAGRPVIAHQRCFEWPCRLTRVLAENADRVIAISDAVQASIADLAGPHVRTVRIYDGIDAGRFANLDQRRGAARSRFGLRREDIVVGIVASHLAWKGHAVFLRALRAVVARRPHVVSLVVGGRPAAAPEMCPSVRQLIADIGLRDHVRLVDHLPDPVDVYASCDVAVHAATQPEPLGLVVLEAMAAGVPVVAAQPGGPAETVPQGRAGLLYPAGDAPALARCIERLVESEDLRRRMGGYGRAHVLARYDIGRAMDQTFALVDEALTARCTERNRNAACRFAPLPS